MENENPFKKVSEPVVKDSKQKKEETTYALIAVGCALFISILAIFITMFPN